MRELVKRILLEKTAEFDPSIDTSEESDFYREVVAPVLALLGTDEERQTSLDLLLERLEEQYPGKRFDRTDALADLFLKPLSFLILPLASEIRRLRQASSLADAAFLSKSDIERLAANFFITPKASGKRRGFVRVYFASPRLVSFDESVNFIANDGKMFQPAVASVVTPEAMSLNKEGDLYYAEVQIEALDAGGPDLPPHSILGVIGLDGVVRVDNLSPIEGAAPEETPEELLARIQLSLTERGLATERAIKATLSEEVPSVRRVEVVKAGDRELLSDRLLLKSLDSLPHVRSYAPLLFPTSTTATVRLETGHQALKEGPHDLLVQGLFPNIGALVELLNRKWRTAGGTGAPFYARGNYLYVAPPYEPGIVGAYLVLHGSNWALLGMSPTDIRIETGPDPRVDAGPQGLGEERAGGLTLHIGGTSDVYYGERRFSRTSIFLDSPSGLSLKWQGDALKTTGDVATDESASTHPGKVTDFEALPLPPRPASGDGQILGGKAELGDVVEVGSTRAYLIGTPSTDSSLAQGEIRLDQSAGIGKSPWKLYRHCTVSLGKGFASTVVPSSVGFSLHCVGGTSRAVWRSLSAPNTDFSFWGVQTGDILFVYEQDDGQPTPAKGTYIVAAVSGNTLDVDKPFPTSAKAKFAVLRGNSPFSLPILAVEEMWLHQGDAKTKIPPARPLAVISRGLAGGQVFASGEGKRDPSNSKIIRAPLKFASLGVRAGQKATLYLSNGNVQEGLTVTAASDDLVLLSEEIAAEEFHFEIGTPSRGKIALCYEEPTTVTLGELTLKDAGGSPWKVMAPPKERERVIYPRWTSPGMWLVSRSGQTIEIADTDQASPVDVQAELAKPGDVLRIWPEQLIGLWGSSSGDTIERKKRLAWGVALSSGNSLLVPPDALYLPIDSYEVKDAIAFFGGAPFTIEASKTFGSYAYGLSLSTAPPPSAPRPNSFGRSSWESFIIEVAPGPGEYIPGEVVENGSSSYIVHSFDAAQNKLYVYGDPQERILPSSGNWTGKSSGASRSLVGYSSPYSLTVNDGTRTISFSPSLPGGEKVWKPGNYVYLFGVYTGLPTLQDIEDAIANKGAWRIVSADASTGEVTLEDPLDFSRALRNTSGSLQMAWVVGEGGSPAEELRCVSSIFLEHEITQVSRTKITANFGTALDGPSGSLDEGGFNSRCAIIRPGMQSFSRSDFQKDGPLYFIEALVESSRPGVSVPAEEQLRVAPSWVGDSTSDGSLTGEGYWIEEADPAESYTAEEDMRIGISARYLPSDVLEKEANKLYTVEARLEVVCSVASSHSLVEEMLTGDRKPVCGRLRARAMLPALFYLSIDFTPDEKPDEEIQQLISELVERSTAVEAQQLESKLSPLGAINSQDYWLWLLCYDLERKPILVRSRTLVEPPERKLSSRRLYQIIARKIAIGG